MAIAKTTDLMYRLNVQVTAYGRQTVPDWGVVRSCDPLQTFGAAVISLERQLQESMLKSDKIRCRYLVTNCVSL